MVTMASLSFLTMEAGPPGQALVYCATFSKVCRCSLQTLGGLTQSVVPPAKGSGLTFL